MRPKCSSEKAVLAGVGVSDTQDRVNLPFAACICVFKSIIYTSLVVWVQFGRRQFSLDMMVT